jgi:uncharacterized flavoprotein (TIGR03862 family)
MAPPVTTTKTVSIVGTGPAALMAAEVLSRSPQLRVSLFEKRRSPGRKILIAGSSGLNITNKLAVDEFARAYSGSAPSGFWRTLLNDFSPQDWLQYLETTLGQKTFLGTSGRYFVKEMKASKMLRAWLHHLGGRGVQLHMKAECVDFSTWGITLADGTQVESDAVILALGGASYEPEEMPLRWVELFRRKNIPLEEFRPSNAGHEVNWSPAFLKEAEGKPLKNIILSTSRGSKRGELVVTRYGLEGTPVYTYGAVGPATLDLIPEISEDEAFRRCQSVKENLSPLRRIQKKLSLGEAAQALIFHHTGQALKSDLRSLIRTLKSFPLQFTGVRPLTESISSAGGVSFAAVNPETLALRSLPNVYCVGEMLDWDAPTGGFLIQGCVSSGYRAGTAALRSLRAG